MAGWEFGVGRGVLTFYDPFHINPQASRERYAEALDIIVGAWTQDSFSYEGKHFQVREASLVPKPVQQPHPPLTVAASGSQGVFDIAAKRGMGVMAGLFLTPMETLKDRAATYRQVESDAGLPHKPDFMKILQPTFVSETIADAQEATRASVDQYFDALKINLDSPAGDRIIEAVPEYSHFKEARDEHSHEQIRQKGHGPLPHPRQDHRKAQLVSSPSYPSARCFTGSKWAASSPTKRSSTP